MKFKKGDRLYYKMNPSVRMYVMEVDDLRKSYLIEDTRSGMTWWYSCVYVEMNFEKE